MEYTEVKEWLDKLIEANKEIKSMKSSLGWFSSDIRAIIHYDPCILIYKGIEIIADVMGLELKQEVRETSVQLSFEYSGTTFLQIYDLEDNENEVQGNK